MPFFGHPVTQLAGLQLLSFGMGDLRSFVARGKKR